MLKIFWLTAIFFGCFAVECMHIPPETIPTGVCPERIPFYNYEGTSVCEYSFFSKINVPINNGSGITTIEERYGKAHDRLFSLAAKLERFQLEDATIPLINKLIICDAIISSAQNILDTFNYWAVRGFDKFDPQEMQTMERLKILILETRAELVAGGSGCVRHNETLFFDIYDECDIIDAEEVPVGIYPDDLPRLGELYRKHRKVLPESIFFKLMIPEGSSERKINLPEGLGVLKNTLAELLQNLNNPLIGRKAKLESWKAVLTSAEHANNAILHWYKEGFRLRCTDGIFGAYPNLKDFVSEIYDELLNSESGCVANRELPIFDKGPVNLVCGL
ncbi:MAG: hypothetical protein LBO73_01000 [Holosporaceae bacterium]|jgi:hypothetical protein|nr:hypothetical protein [Holosporaceae bacterium]